MQLDESELYKIIWYPQWHDGVKCWPVTIMSPTEYHPPTGQLKFRKEGICNVYIFNKSIVI